MKIISVTATVRCDCVKIRQECAWHLAADPQCSECGGTGERRQDISFEDLAYEIEKLNRADNDD